MSDIKQDGKQHGLWFEEFVEGLSIETRGRTITEADLVNFSGVSGDFNPMHTDAEFAATTPYGKRVAHGALVFSIATGLTYQLGFLEGTIMAFTGLEWKFRDPVFIGDTVKVSASVVKRRAMPATGGGFVTFDVKVTNQAGKVAQKGEWTILVRSSAPDASQPTSPANADNAD